VTDDGRVEITLRDVWEAQHDSAVQLSAISTQLASLTTRVDGRLDTAQQTTTDHEARLRLLEKFRYTLMGAVVALQVLAGTAEYLFTHK
jgi:hypothetical protein